MKIFVLVVLFIAANSSITIAQHSAPDSDSVTVTFEVVVPESTPEDATIFWAGSLNSWDPGDKGKGFGPKRYAQPATSRDGSWTISMKAPKNSEESYKYTRGSIYSAEEQADFTYRPVRKVVFDKSKTIRDTVEAWHDLPPKSLQKNWPRLNLKETDINISRNGVAMDGTGTILYDKATGSQRYNFNEANTQVKDIPENFYDAVYYHQKISAATDDLQLIAAAKIRPEGDWRIFVDVNNDKIIDESEEVLKIKESYERQEWSGKIYDQTSADSVDFSVIHVPDLPAGYTSSANTDAPDLAYKLPFKHRRANINGHSFNVTATYYTLFSNYHHLTIDRNRNDTLEIGSGSNEVYSSDANQMFRTKKFFLYPSFKLGGNHWQVANIDPHGEWIRLRPGTDESAKKKIVEGKSAPDWQAITVTGNTINSDNLRGKYILLDFWGSWCGPCIEEIPLLKKTYHQFKDHDFEMIGFAYQSRESLDKALEEYQLPWPQIADEKGEYSTEFLVRGYPTHYLIGPDGTVLEKGSNLRGEQLITTLEKYLE